MTSILEALDSFFNDKEWIANNESRGNDIQVGVLLYIHKDKIADILDNKELNIISKISDAFWDVDIKGNSIYERHYARFFTQRDSLIHTRETHYFLIIARKYESHDYSFMSFDKVVDGKIAEFAPKPNQNTINNTIQKIVDFFSYLYIPVETTVSEFLKLEAAGMQLLADKNLKNAISNALNDKRITRTNGKNNRTRKISIIEIINEKLEEYIQNIEIDIQKIDPTYDFKPSYRQSSKLTPNHLANVIINAYYAKRTLKKEKKPISTLSSGEKRRTLVDIIYVFLSNHNIERNLILAIDEPESSLHISKCYDQFRKIQSIALECNQQLFITTHWYGSLPILNKGNLIHIQSNQQLSLFEISNYFEERRHHPDDINLKSFFDLAASIVSAYRNSNYHWLLVEGKEDMQYLTYYLNDVNINILPLSGCGNVKKIYEYLYPDDSTNEGKKLRLRQQYFLVSASLQNIVNKYGLDNLEDKIKIQLNDTHPILAIPELINICIKKNMSFDDAFIKCQKIFAYTNHTVMPEALEEWDCSLIKEVIPQIYGIIEKINDMLLSQIN